MLKQFLPCSDKGNTLLEFLVAMVLGLMLGGMCWGATFSQQRLYGFDAQRARQIQNMRAALDFVGTDVRQAGERLPEGFLAIEIIDGDAGEPDQLVLRRNLLDEVLTVCETILAGDTESHILLSTTDSGASPACVYGGQNLGLSTWSNYRTEQGGTVKAYIYNLGTQEGEFIELIAENDSGTELSIQKSAGSFSHTYNEEVSAIYALVEWRYQISDTEPMFQVVENEDEANPSNIVFGVDMFQAAAVLSDGTMQDSFGAGDSWAQLQGIEVRMTGTFSYRGQSKTTTLSSRFFPRNVLSL